LNHAFQNDVQPRPDVIEHPIVLSSTGYLNHLWIPILVIRKRFK
jgi:hypothetical protein